jgi:hypothetical protein
MTTPEEAARRIAESSLGWSRGEAMSVARAYLAAEARIRVLEEALRECLAIIMQDAISDDDAINMERGIRRALAKEGAA